LLAECGDETIGQYYLWWMEQSLGLQRLGLEQKHAGSAEPLPKSIEIMDCRNVGMWRITKEMLGIKRLMTCLRIGQEYYPEHLRQCFIINAPTFFTVIWSLLSNVLAQETLDKIVVAGDDQKEALLEFMDDATWEAMLAVAEPPPEAEGGGGWFS